MRKKTMRIVGGIVLILLIIGGIWFFGLRDEPVEAYRVRGAPYEEKIIAVGQLELARETQLVAEVSGRVEAVTVGEGDMVKAGALLMKIDAGDLAFQLEERKASYMDASAQYDSLVNMDYIQAKDDYNRLSSLKERMEQDYQDAVLLYAEGAISQRAMEEKKTGYESVQSQWTAARLLYEGLSSGGSLRDAGVSKLKLARASYERAKNLLSNYQVAAPWDGVLLKTYVKPGDLVQPGTLLAEVGDPGGFRVIAELDEKYVPYVSSGLPVSVYIGQEKNGKTEGFVDVVTPKINFETGTFEISIRLPEGFSYLVSDLTVNLEILLKKEAEALLLPGGYLAWEREDKIDPYVFVYQEGRVEKRFVTVEPGLSGRVVITDGITAGDLILRPGDGMEEGAFVGAYEEVEAS